MFVLTRRSVPHIDMGTEPPLAHIGAVNPSSDARGNFQTTFAAFRTVFNALCRETNADPGAPRVGPPHRREDLGGLSGHLDQNFRRLDRESQVRAGLPAGGRRIRTRGPALRRPSPRRAHRFPRRSAGESGTAGGTKVRIRFLQWRGIFMLGVRVRSPIRGRRLSAPASKVV